MTANTSPTGRPMVVTIVNSFMAASFSYALGGHARDQPLPHRYGGHRGPANRTHRTVLGDVPTPADLKVGSMREEVGVASPEPAVGVFTTAGTCQGHLRRHFRDALVRS